MDRKYSGVIEHSKADSSKRPLWMKTVKDKSEIHHEVRPYGKSPIIFLYQFLSSEFHMSPEYVVEMTEDPDFRYKTDVKIGGRVIASALGKSKRFSKRGGAIAALQALKPDAIPFLQLLKHERDSYSSESSGSSVGIGSCVFVCVCVCVCVCMCVCVWVCVGGWSSVVLQNALRCSNKAYRRLHRDRSVVSGIRCVEREEGVLGRLYFGVTFSSSSDTHPCVFDLRIVGRTTWRSQSPLRMCAVAVETLARSLSSSCMNTSIGRLTHVDTYMHSRVYPSLSFAHTHTHTHTHTHSYTLHTQSIRMFHYAHMPNSHIHTYLHAFILTYSLPEQLVRLPTHNGHDTRSTYHQCSVLYTHSLECILD
jgi:hypothetical protein